MLITYDRLKVMLLSLLLLVLSGCDNGLKTNEQQSTDNALALDELTLSPKENTNRWYFSEQLSRGKIIFAKNCAVCHGNNAEATPDWKTPNAQGHYPPPPLNGTAHAWHHPLSILVRTIYTGGAPVGGQMPAFKNQLNETDMVDVMAYFQSYWSDDVYQRWLSIERSSRE